MADQTSRQEFDQHVDEFRRHFLERVLLFLGGLVWAVASVALITTSSAIVLVLATGFGLLCILSYYLSRRRRLVWARGLFAIGLCCWSLSVPWLLHQPELLIFVLLAAPVNVILLSPLAAVLTTVLLIFGEIAVSQQIIPLAGWSWSPLLLPLGIISLAGLAFLRNADFVTTLDWALNSVHSAIARLDEVQEHRARLFRNMRDLDIAYTRLERLNEMLAAARAAAEEARQARNQFALTVSHELRTPLNFIIGFSELMVNAPGTYGDLDHWPPGLHDDIQEIYHNSRHLLRLVNDVLDLGKAEAHRLALVKEWLAPAMVVQEAVEIMAAGVAARGLWLRVEVAADLPELFIDRTRIRQVLINLISNGLRFTEQGGLTVTAGWHEEGVLFSVRDTGSGIADEEVDKVFEVFGQANATVWRRRDGSGLGVPISRRFVMMHGGRMWLESQVGQGTAVYFTLPLPGRLTDPSALPEFDTSDHWHLVAKEKQGSRLVFVLSANPAAAGFLENSLSATRVIAVDGANALSQLTRLLPRVLIVDRFIADQPAVQDLLQHLPYDLPVLTISFPGSSPPDWRLPPGVHDYLMKPVARGALAEMLTRLEPRVQRVLHVDDDPSMTRFVSMALAATEDTRHIELRSAASGEEALERLEGTLQDPVAEPKPDAILLDLDLPGMSGWDVLSSLQAHAVWRDIPVILMTASSLSEEIEARTHKRLEISTRRALTPEELGAVITGLMEAIRPDFPAGVTPPTASETVPE